MADKPSSPDSSSVEDGHAVAWKIIFIIILLSGLASTFNVGKEDTQEIQDASNISEEQVSSSGQITNKEKIELGKSIITKKTTEIRQSPGGNIIGYQKGGTKGRVMEGPVNLYQREWWRIDFKNNPDGWVNSEHISNNTLLYGVLNFFPKLLDVFKLLMFWLLIFVIIAIIFVIVKTTKLNKLKEEKKKLKDSTGMVYRSKYAQDSKTEIKNVEVVKTENSETLISKEQEIEKMANNNLNNISPNVSEMNSGGNNYPIPNLPVGDFDMKTFLGISKTESKQNDQNTMYQKNENERWENIKRLMKSHNSNDWRQAILESDIILDEMVIKMGYEGNTLGDRLKKVESSDFLTLDKAWEAHKVRNRIAHRGRDYVLGREEAEKVIKLYEEVFQEFYYI
jgi:hypothetical protein